MVVDTNKVVIKALRKGMVKYLNDMKDCHIPLNVITANLLSEKREIGVFFNFNLFCHA